MAGQAYETVPQHDEIPLPLYSPSMPSTTYKTPTHSAEGPSNLNAPVGIMGSTHNGVPGLGAPVVGGGEGGDLESGLSIKLENILQRLDIIESAVLPTREEIDEARTVERQRREERRICMWKMIHLWAIMGFVMLIIFLKTVRGLWM